MYVNSLAGVRQIVAAESLTSAAVISSHVCMLPMEVKQIKFAVSTATVSSGDIVITAKKYVTIGSATGAVTLGTLTIPTGVAAGKVYYKPLDPNDASFLPGEVLVFEVTTAAAGGGAAGAGSSLFEADYAPSDVRNDSDAVLSA